MSNSRIGCYYKCGSFSCLRRGGKQIGGKAIRILKLCYALHCQLHVETVCHILSPYPNHLLVQSNFRQIRDIPVDHIKKCCSATGIFKRITLFSCVTDIRGWKTSSVHEVGKINI